MTVNSFLKWIPVLAVATTSATAWAHGYVPNVSRAHKCSAEMGKLNANCGQIQYEPQSLEGKGGFPFGDPVKPSLTGPVDGMIASAGNLVFKELDVQNTTRWHKTNHTVGKNMEFSWNFKAAHRTADFKYYVTKPGWNPNQALTRNSFNLTPFCDVNKNAGGNFNLSNGIPISGMKHFCATPTDSNGAYLSGYHVVLAVWRVGDTDNAFYNVIDVNFQSSGGDVVTPPTDPTPPTGPTPPTDTVNPGEPTLIKEIFSYNLKTTPVIKAGDEIFVDFAVGSNTVMDYTLSIRLPVTEVMLSDGYGVSAAIARAINNRHPMDLVAGQMVNGQVKVVSNAPNSVYKLPSGKITGVEFKHVPANTSVHARYDRTRTAYKVGDVVSHTSNLYQCKVPSWCSQNGFAPGSLHSDNAWTKLPEQISYNPAEQATPYVSGKAYYNADVVSNVGGFYSCKVAGWCATPAFAPGGVYSDSAWNRIR